jgi:hypothetical protein
MEEQNQTPNVPEPVQSPSPAPVAPVTPAPVAQSSTNPGHGLGIASLILSIIGVGLVGLILGIVGLSKSKKAGHKNGLAIAGIIVGIVNIIVVTLIVVTLTSAALLLASKCNELGSGTHVIDNGTTITCPSTSSTTN